MTLTIRHVAWVAGMIAGGIIGAAVAPAWELAPFVVGFVASLTGALSAGCAVFGPKGLFLAAVATVLGSGIMFLIARENPRSIVESSVAAVFLGGFVAASLGALLTRSGPSR